MTVRSATILLTLLCMGGATPSLASDKPKNCPEAPAASKVQYLLSSQVDVTSMLPPPPHGAAQQQQDLDAVLAAQRAAHKAGTLEHAIADATEDCVRFSDALGYDLSAKEAEKALAFVNKAAHEAGNTVGAAKNYWKRPRPYMASSQVEKLADMTLAFYQQDYAKQQQRRKEEEAQRDPACPAPKAEPPDDLQKLQAGWEKYLREDAYHSYPSGHTTFGTACAIVLSQLVPEQRDALFARSRDYGNSRMVVGAHYASDVEAGRLAGTSAMMLMSENAGYERDLATARTQLRALMKLPAEVPDLEPPKVSDKTASP